MSTIERLYDNMMNERVTVCERKVSTIVRVVNPGGGGGCQVQRGAGASVTYFAEVGVFFKTSACPQYRKEEYFFTQVRSIGVKSLK